MTLEPGWNAPVDPLETRHTSCADFGPVARGPLHLPGLLEQGVPPRDPKLSLTPGVGLPRECPAACESSTQTPVLLGWPGALAWPWGSRENLARAGRAVGPQESPWPPRMFSPRPDPHPHSCPVCKAASLPGGAAGSLWVRLRLCGQAAPILRLP